MSARLIRSLREDTEERIKNLCYEVRNDKMIDIAIFQLWDTSGKNLVQILQFWWREIGWPDLCRIEL